MIVSNKITNNLGKRTGFFLASNKASAGEDFFSLFLKRPYSPRVTLFALFIFFTIQPSPHTQQIAYHRSHGLDRTFLHK